MLYYVYRIPTPIERQHMRKLPSEVVNSTKKIVTTRWAVTGLKIPKWIYPLVIWVTAIRSLSYGLELLFTVTSNPISPMMSFAAVFGIQLWGLLMLIGVAFIILGLLFRISILITIGTLVSFAVWTAFSVILGIGYLDLNTGGRFVVAALATAITWGAFFIVQLNTLRLMGDDFE